MSKKYELTDETIIFDGVILHRIKALENFFKVKSGDLGGWIEKEENLYQTGSAWLYNEAKAYGNAVVSNNAKAYDNVVICGNALVCDSAKIYDNAFVRDNAVVCDLARVCGDADVRGSARVCGRTTVHGNAEVSGNAVILGNADYVVFKNFWSSGRYFTWTRSNNMWRVGCFYGTGEELIKKAYKDSEKSGREYERVVKYVESILADEKKGGDK